MRIIYLPILAFLSACVSGGQALDLGTEAALNWALSNSQPYAGNLSNGPILTRNPAIWEQNPDNPTSVSTRFQVGPCEASNLGCFLFSDGSFPITVDNDGRVISSIVVASATPVTTNRREFRTNNIMIYTEPSGIRVPLAWDFEANGDSRVRSRVSQLSQILRGEERRVLNESRDNAEAFSDGLNTLGAIASIANGSPQNLQNEPTVSAQIRTNGTNTNPTGTFLNTAQECTTVDRAEGESSFSYIYNSCAFTVYVRFYDEGSYLRGGGTTISSGERQAIGKLRGNVRSTACPFPATPRSGTDQVSTWSRGEYVCR